MESESTSRRAAAESPPVGDHQARPRRSRLRIPVPKLGGDRRVTVLARSPGSAARASPDRGTRVSLRATRPARTPRAPRPRTRPRWARARRPRRSGVGQPAARAAGRARPPRGRRARARSLRGSAVPTAAAITSETVANVSVATTNEIRGPLGSLVTCTAPCAARTPAFVARRSRSRRGDSRCPSPTAETTHASASAGTKRPREALDRAGEPQRPHEPERRDEGRARGVQERAPARPGPSSGGAEETASEIALDEPGPETARRSGGRSGPPARAGTGRPWRGALRRSPLPGSSSDSSSSPRSSSATRSYAAL